MILCLDIGNSHIFGGVFLNDEIKLRFRYATQKGITSDQLGIFLKNALRENNIDHNVNHIAICSVVPYMDYSLRSACIKYFSIEPFLLKTGVKTGLKIKSRDPREVGTDRIANSIAAIDHFPNKNIIIVDFGTATTLDVISSEKEWLGGVIHPGMQLSMNALQSSTAQLPSVEIKKPNQAIGKSTIENIQSGLFYGHLGMIRELTQCITSEAFKGNNPIILGTGGFSHLFEDQKIFSAIIPDLALHGLKIALSKNS